MIYNHELGCMDVQLNDGSKAHDICSAFSAKKIIINADGTTNLYICVNDHNTLYYDFELPVTLLADTKELHKFLLDQRLTIPIGFSGWTNVYLINNYHKLSNSRKIEFRHVTLGWQKSVPKNQPRLSAKTQKSPSSSTSNYYPFLYESNNINGFPSYYAYDDFEFTRGSEQEYKEFLQNTIFPVPTLSLALAIGYSAVLASRLEDITDCSTMLVNICGSSSSGKTTAQMLMVSPFANPSPKGRGLFRTFQATQNALLAGMGEIHGLPVALDDSSTTPNANFTNLIYSLANGHGKQRCTANGNLQTSQSWSGTVIISSEIPMQEQANNQQGILARILNLNDIHWTPDARTSNLIKRTVKRCYGHTGYDFAQRYCDDKKYDELVDKYDYAQQRVHDLMPNRDNLSDRLEALYALIYLTIQELNEYFVDLQPNLNPDELLKIALKTEQESVVDRDIANRALDFTSEFIFQNRLRFNEFNVQKIIGYDYFPKTRMNACGSLLFKANNRLDVYISEKTLKDELLKEGFGEYRTIISRWKERGLLLHEKNRNTERMPKLQGLDRSFLQRRYIHLVFMNGIKDLSEDDLYEPDDDEIEQPNNNGYEPVPEQPNNNGYEPAHEYTDFPCNECMQPEDDDYPLPPEDITEEYPATRRIVK